jgi:hypothetical protein
VRLVRRSVGGPRERRRRHEHDQKPLLVARPRPSGTCDVGDRPWRFSPKALLQRVHVRLDGSVGKREPAASGIRSHVRGQQRVTGSHPAAFRRARQRRWRCSSWDDSVNCTTGTTITKQDPPAANGHELGGELPAHRPAVRTYARSRHGGWRSQGIECCGACRTAACYFANFGGLPESNSGELIRFW